MYKKTSPVAAGDVYAPASYQQLIMDDAMKAHKKNILSAMISIKESHSFLERLAGDVEYTFQTFSDNKSEDGSPRSPQLLHGRLSDVQDTLLEANCAGDGVFVTVNETNLKGRKTNDIVRVRALFVDLDNAPLSVLDDAEVEPHMVVESSPGKGHAYWLVSDCPLDDFSGYQKKLAKRFGGDPVVHDLPRVMRLPGFCHGKGEPFLCRVNRQMDRVPYTLDELAPLMSLVPAVPVKQALPVAITASLSRSYGDGERTQALVKLAGKLIGDGLSDDDVIHLLIDWNANNTPPLDMAKVIDTVRSIRKTHNRNHGSEDNVIDVFNREYAVALYGKKCVVIAENGGAVEFLPPNDFYAFTANRTLPDGKSASKFWMQHADRRTYRSVTFDPSGNVADDVYNQWKGFAVNSVAGRCDLFLEHTQTVICNNDPVLFEYILDWMADIVQNPAKLLGVAVVLMGGQGTGKGVFMEYFGQLFGPHFQRITNPEHLTGRFCANLSRALLVFADEAFGTANKSKIGALKTLITESHRMLEPKHIDTLEFPNYVRLVMASNEEWVVPAEFDERRFCVLKISDGKKGNTGYFNAILDERDKGGKEALLHFLQQRDLMGKDLRHFPVTGALIGQKLKNLKSHELWLYNQLQLGQLDGKEITGSESGRYVPKERLYTLYTDFCNRMKRHSVTDLAGFYRSLYAIIPGITKHRPRNENGSYHAIQFPPLDECQTAFEKWVGGTIDWTQ